MPRITISQRHFDALSHLATTSNRTVTLQCQQLIEEATTKPAEGATKPAETAVFGSLRNLIRD